jgi:hypothetical protein
MLHMAIHSTCPLIEIYPLTEMGKDPNTYIINDPKAFSIENMQKF